MILIRRSQLPKRLSGRISMLRGRSLFPAKGFPFEAGFYLHDFSYTLDVSLIRYVSKEEERRKALRQLAHAYLGRLERTMIPIPARLTRAPTRSQRVGRWPSTSHSQMSATVM
jgi:hypothetical protein